MSTGLLYTDLNSQELVPAFSRREECGAQASGLKNWSSELRYMQKHSKCVNLAQRSWSMVMAEQYLILGLLPQILSCSFGKFGKKPWEGFVCDTVPLGHHWKL